MQFFQVAILLSVASARSLSKTPQSAFAGLAVDHSDFEVVANEDAELNASTPQHTYNYAITVPMGSGKLTKKSGTLLTTPKQYAQFYGNGSWTTSNVAIYEDFLNAIGAHAYLAKSRSLGAGTATYVITTNRIIINGGSGTTEIDTSAELHAKAKSAVGQYSETQNGNHMYHFIPDVAKSAGMSGYTTQWCGWHSESSTGGKKYTYSVNGRSFVSGCSWWTQPVAGVNYNSPNGLDVDYQISVLAHEAAEMLTDPWVSTGIAWTDDAGYENADKCNGLSVGFNKDTTTLKMWNAVIAGKQFLLQQSYDNDTGAAGSCPSNIWD